MLAAALASPHCSGPHCPPRAEPVEIVALGDSLTAGYGLGPGEAFPEQLEAALKARGHDVTVANAGVSGDTASDGLARLEWSVPAEADIVIVELGANDALRGIDPAVTRQALSEIVAKLTGRGQAVLLAGMLAPPNLGHAYAEAVQPDLSGPRRRVRCRRSIPSSSQAWRPTPALNQPDGMHPTAAGVAKSSERCFRMWRQLIAKVDCRRTELTSCRATRRR